MNLIVAFLIMTGLQGELVQYDLEMDQQYVDLLYANPYSGDMYPGFFSCPQGEATCMAGFRGTTSMGCTKKSWQIELDDPTILGRSTLILDAHMRDSTLTRNCIALMLTDMLGYPAPDTRHVRFVLNGDYYGVYLDTEAPDADFLEHSGFEGCNLWKGIEQRSRFCWLPSGSWFDECFEVHLDSDPGMLAVRRLVDLVNGGGPLPPMDPEMFLAYYAVTLAAMDTDAPMKNFYLHLPSDSVWRIFPWDRDATFGNDWQGIYNPDLVRLPANYFLQNTALFARLMEDPSNAVFFSTCLDSVAVLMSEELPGIVDSIRIEIREDVLEDPLAGLSAEQFDSAFDDLSAFISERPQYLFGLGAFYQSPMIEGMTVTPAHMSASTDSVRVSLRTGEPLDSAILDVSVDGGEPVSQQMTAVSGSGYRTWRGSVPAGIAERSLFFAARTYPESSMPNSILFCFPLYGFIEFRSGASAHPCSVRPAGVFEPDSLELLAPLRMGPDLWALPVVNVAGSVQDLSYCSVSTGNPSGWVFFPDSVLLQPGDTLFVTSCVRSMEIEFPWRQCVGDCAAPSPAGSDMVLRDPAWEERLSLAVPAEDSVQLETPDLVLSEICYDCPITYDSGDWLEFYNAGDLPVELGGFILSDYAANSCRLPWGAVLQPSECFLVVSDPDRFRQVNPTTPVDAVISFSLGNNGDTVLLTDRTGTPVTAVSWSDDPPWPDASGKVLSLLHYALPEEQPGSWEAVDVPGSPGLPNPSWSASSEVTLRIGSLWPNPAASSVTFSYTALGLPIEGFVFDLSGRKVQLLPELPPYTAEVSFDLDPDLAPGVYFLLLRSSGEISVRRFVCLR
jgi:hypothetical protein